MSELSDAVAALTAAYANIAAVQAKLIADAEARGKTDALAESQAASASETTQAVTAINAVTAQITAAFPAPSQEAPAPPPQAGPEPNDPNAPMEPAPVPNDPGSVA